MKKIFLAILATPVILSCVAASIGESDNSANTTLQSSKTKVDTTVFVERHNYYRSKVGSPPIKWNDSLAMFAQSWADHLAKTCDFEHSDADYGENIYWSSAPADEIKVVDKWASEEKYFNHNDPTYYRNTSSKSGHYSQVIWAKSTELGAGYANCKNGSQIWVCVYNPAGNMIGEKAY